MCTFSEKPCVSLLRGEPPAQKCDGVEPNRASCPSGLLFLGMFLILMTLPAWRSFFENCDSTPAVTPPWTEICFSPLRYALFFGPEKQCGDCFLILCGHLSCRMRVFMEWPAGLAGWAPGWPRMVPIGSRWRQIGAKSPQIAPDGSRWAQMALDANLLTF